MGYAIALFLDDKESQDILDSFEDTGSILHEIGATPHVSLAVFDDVDVAKLISVTKAFSKKTSSFSLQLSSIGMFPGATNTVFLTPVVTKELLNMHEIFHADLAAVGIESDAYYKPGGWVPHCTISMEEPFEKSLKTISYIYNKTQMLKEYHIRQIDVIKFRPVVSLESFQLLRD